MVVVMKSTATQEDIEGVKKEMETYGLNMMVSHGDDYTILGAEGKLPRWIRKRFLCSAVWNGSCGCQSRIRWPTGNTIRRIRKSMWAA